MAMVPFLLAFIAVTPPVIAGEEPVLIASTPTYSKGWQKVALARHEKPKEGVLAGLKDSQPDERVGSAALIWTKFPEEREAVLRVMREDADLDVRRRIASVLAMKYKQAEAIAFLESQAKGRFDLQLEGSADLYLGLSYKLTELTGKPHGVEGALTILEAPTTWFADAAVRYPQAPELRKDGLRIMAASFLASVKEMQGNVRFRQALSNYFELVEQKVKSSDSAERKKWVGRLWTILDIGIRAGFPDLALKYQDRLSLASDSYNRKAFADVIEKARKAKAVQSQEKNRP